MGVLRCPVLESCLLVFFDAGRPWGHRVSVSAGAASASAAQGATAGPSASEADEKEMPAGGTAADLNEEQQTFQAQSQALWRHWGDQARRRRRRIPPLRLVSRPIRLAVGP